jgi:hypothetical protein
VILGMKVVFVIIFEREYKKIVFPGIARLLFFTDGAN